ncbi:hypothetical protein [Gordonia sp. OPL2]|uniref:hypothetical protein n=1 Tax=Gordonia sp. OPL2 TaxID=2486274 RepID=UPI00165564CC|nr:hypothetical protein [Gordonia sp. OPL2]RPA20004.1 hypothetical protein EEB19_02950 [Gordonia sp. OPL2]
MPAKPCAQSRAPRSRGSPRDQLADGSWAPTLVDLARRDADALAHLLGHQNKNRRGGETASDTVIEALRALDRAALDTHRRIDRSDFFRSQFGDTSRRPTQPSDAQMARDVLAELGIDETAKKDSAS